VPLNLNDRVSVIRSRAMIDRCVGVVVNFANYVLGEPSNTSNHTNRIAWAREAIRDPFGVGDRVSFYVFNDPAFIGDGSGIGDAALTGVIETAINTHLITPLV